MNNSSKRILARGCDPVASFHAAQAIPRQLGNPQYIPTTEDDDFFNKLKSEKWDVVYFAPGACRFSAAKVRIPGSNQKTSNWTLEDYKKVVQLHQGSDVQIVETPYETQTIALLKEALSKA